METLFETASKIYEFLSIEQLSILRAIDTSSLIPNDEDMSEILFELQNYNLVVVVPSDEASFIFLTVLGREVLCVDSLVAYADSLGK